MKKILDNFHYANFVIFILLVISSVYCFADGYILFGTAHGMLAIWNLYCSVANYRLTKET